MGFLDLGKQIGLDLQFSMGYWEFITQWMENYQEVKSSARDLLAEMS
jgi:hypothetical protein